MDKRQFLEILDEELRDNLQASEAQYQLSYYTNYINSQISAGRSEAEVMAELGDPRMIARTVIDGERDAGAWIRGEGEDADAHVYDETESMDEQQTANDTPYETYDPFSGLQPEKPDLKTKFKIYGTIALVLVIIFLILAIVFKLFIMFLPAIVCVAVISWIIKKFS